VQFDFCIIPEIPKLVDNELIFWDYDSLELQKPYMNLVDLLIRNTRDE